MVELKESKGKVCKGCGGDCPNCGGVVNQSKFAGKPKEYCCLGCKGRATSRDHYRRNYEKQDDTGRKTAVMRDARDFNRLVEAHKRKGHDGGPCPAPVVPAPGGCLVLAVLMDDQREARGLNRMVEEICKEGN